jgi:hypothetical protein
MSAQKHYHITQSAESAGHGKTYQPCSLSPADGWKRPSVKRTDNVPERVQDKGTGGNESESTCSLVKI